jgi:hypothetical protein
MVYNKLDFSRIDNYWEMLQGIKQIVLQTIQETKPKTVYWI